MISSHAATIMRVLTDDEREILRLRFREDLYLSEVAERVGVSPTHVARMLQRSIEALHETATGHPADRAGKAGHPGAGPCGVRSPDARRAV